MASIRIPAALRTYTGGSDTVAVRGMTVEEALGDLIRQHPALEPHLFDAGALRSFVNIFLGEQDIRYLDGVQTHLPDEARLLIIPSIAGGQS